MCNCFSYVEAKTPETLTVDRLRFQAVEKIKMRPFYKVQCERPGKKSAWIYTTPLVSAISVDFPR